MSKTIKKKPKYPNLQWNNPKSESLVFNERVEIYPFSPKNDIDEYRQQFIPDYEREGFGTYQLVDSYAEQLSYVIKNRANGLIVGPTGCGKSSGIRYVCSLLEYPTRTFEFNGQSSISSLIGTRTVKPLKNGNGSYVTWINGIALDCWEKGMLLILEEVDSGNPSLLFSLHSLLQVKSLYFEVPEKSDKLIKRHPDFCVLATANTIGKGEDTFLYTGTNILNEAFLDRFSITHRLDYLSMDDEINIILDECNGIHKEFATAYARCFDLLRSSEDLKTTCFSTRRLLEWVKLTQQLDWRKPIEFAECALFNRMTLQNKEVTKRVLLSVWGSDEQRINSAEIKQDPSKVKHFDNLIMPETNDDNQT